MKPARVRTNTATGMQWLWYIKRIAGRMERNGVVRRVIDGYLLTAKKAGLTRIAQILDRPVQVRLYGVLGGVDGEAYESPAFAATMNRDGFSGTLDANVSAASQEALDAAVFPVPSVTFVGVGPPLTARVVERSIVALPAPRKEVNHQGQYELLSDVSALEYYPMTASTNLWVGAYYYGRENFGVSVVVSEGTVAELTGGYLFFPRNVAPDSVFLLPAVTLPRPATDYLGDQLATIIPVVKQLSGTHSEDYGNLAFYGAFATRGEETTSVSNVLYTFPSIPQYEQVESGSDGVAPHVCEIAGCYHPNGEFTVYGHLFVPVFRDGSTSSTPEEQMVTRFQLSVALNKVGSWTVLRTDVSNDDAVTGLGPRRVNSQNGQFLAPAPPAVFFGAGDPWAFSVQFTPENNRLFTRPEGEAAVMNNTSMLVVRDGQIVDEGKPAGCQFVRGVGTEIAVYLNSELKARQGTLVCAHVNTSDIFGVTFFVFDAATDALRLAKWDTIDGFGYWEDYDLSAIGGTPNFLPAVTCYRMADVVETETGSEISGRPGFLVSGVFDSDEKTYIVNRGRAKFLAPAAGLSALVLGSNLSKGPLNRIYKE